MLLGTEEFKESRAQAWRDIREAEGAMEVLSENWTDPDNVVRLTEVRSLLNNFERFQREIEEIIQKPENRLTPPTAPKQDLARLWLGNRAAPLGDRLTTLLDQMVASQHGLLKADADKIDALTFEMNSALVVLSFSGLMIAGIVGFRLSRSVIQPIEQAVVLAERVAEGHFTELPNLSIGGSGSETGKLMAALTRMAGQLDKMVTDLRLSETTTRTIIDESLTGILLTDAGGNILRANTAVIKMFDYRKGSILKQNMSALIAAPVAGGYDNLPARSLRGSVRCGYPTEIERS